MGQNEQAMADTDGVSIVKNYLEAAKARDFIRLGVGFDKDIIWHQPGNSSISGTYRGLADLFDLFLKLDGLSGSSFRIDSIGEVMANGDLVTAMVHYSAKGGGGGISMMGTDVFKIRGGKIVEVWPFSPDQDAEDAFWDRLKIM